MRIKVILIIGFALFFAFGAFGQRKLQNANELYEKFAYSDAVKLYEEVVLDGNTSDEVITRMANCYRLIGNSVQAEYWYSLVVELPDSKPIALYHYAQALKQNRKYDKSLKWMKKYAAIETSDTRAKRELEEQKRLSQILRERRDVSIRNLAINSVNADFGAFIIDEGTVVYASSRDEGKVIKRIYLWDNLPYLDLYKADRIRNGNLSNPRKLSDVINTKYHEGPATFNQNGNLIYFTRNNFHEGDLTKSSENVNNLNIYSAVKMGEEWGNVKAFAFNDKEFSTGHPALDVTGNFLYFSSDRPGGFGGTDIYVSEKIGSAWGVPENMGENINTEGDEMFPFIDQRGVLFFSSDGHLNLGGLDIFYAVPSDTSFSEVVNMGQPINSSKDDFALVTDTSGLSGYLSSNRRGGKGNDDLYAFFVEETLIDTTETDTVPAGPDQPVASDEGEPGPPISFDSITDPPDLSVGTRYVLDNIYYDLDKWNIRPDAARELDKVVDFMKKYPSVAIELSSHTDSRASDDYNMALSHKRAVSAVMYLVEHGINARRLTAQGYGENRLTNHCEDGVDCTEAQHQMNRRTEIMIVSQ